MHQSESCLECINIFLSFFNFFNASKKQLEIINLVKIICIKHRKVSDIFAVSVSEAIPNWLQYININKIVTGRQVTHFHA